jgi:hypothetical protein
MAWVILKLQYYNMKWKKQNYSAALLSFYTSSRRFAYLHRHRKCYNFLPSMLTETVWIVYMNVEILIHLGCFNTLDTTATFNPAPLALINNYNSHVGLCKGYGSGISIFSNKQNFCFATDILRDTSSPWMHINVKYTSPDLEKYCVTWYHVVL